MLLSIFPLPRLLSCWERTAASHLDFTRRPVHAYISARLLPQTPHTLGFSRRRPVVATRALSPLLRFERPVSSSPFDGRPRRRLPSAAQ